MWIEILKKSYTEDLKIKKNTVLGFIVIEPENLSQKHKTPKSKKKRKRKRYYRKRGTSGSKKTTTTTTKENSEDVFFRNMILLMPVQTQLIKQQK